MFNIRRPTIHDYRKIIRDIPYGYDVDEFIDRQERLDWHRRRGLWLPPDLIIYRKELALPTPVQFGSGGAGPTNITSFTATFTNPMAGGNTGFAVVGGAGVGGAAISTVVDDKGNSWTLIDSKTNAASTALNGSAWYHPNSTAGAQVLTCTFAGSFTGTTSAQLAEYAITGATPLDVHTATAGTGTGSPQTVLSGTTAATIQASELIVGWLVSNSTPSPPTLSSPNPSNDFTTRIQVGQQASISDKIVSATGAQSASYVATYPSTMGYICGVATFKIPPATTLPELMMTGCGSL